VMLRFRFPPPWTSRELDLGGVLGGSPEL